ncbi:hypothetical protein LINGRAHAP2_LOCUS25976 [Linum grandiflorum]
MASKFHSASLFIMVLLVLGAVTMVERVEAKTCAIFMYSSGCTPDDCYEKCKVHGPDYIGVCVPNSKSSSTACDCLYKC